ncbi:hypothetical protein Goarm_018520, partial [Gossypium armourianum]|nr:hypothetical protein [Gossypium armourianum]
MKIIQIRNVGRLPNATSFLQLILQSKKQLECHLF